MKTITQERFTEIWNDTVRLGSYDPQTETIACPPYRIENYARSGLSEVGTLYIKDTQIISDTLAPEPWNA